MNELKVTGRQEFMGLEIPVVLGGFGEGKKCISDKTVAEIHGMEMFKVRERIQSNIKRFQEGIDFIDIKQRILLADTLETKEYYIALLIKLGYAKQSITQAEHIYILSERGYVKLIKIMDTDLAWEIHDKLMDEYFEMRGEKHFYEELSPELQAIFAHDKKIQVIDKRLDHIENTMTIDYGQQQELRNIAKCRALTIIGGKDSRAYTFIYPSKGKFDKPVRLYGRLNSRMWHDYQDYFRINSYRNTPAVRYEEAVAYLNRWTAPINIQLDIEKANADDLNDYHVLN